MQNECVCIQFRSKYLYRCMMRIVVPNRQIKQKDIKRMRDKIIKKQKQKKKYSQRQKVTSAK